MSVKRPHTHVEVKPFGAASSEEVESATQRIAERATQHATKTDSFTRNLKKSARAQREELRQQMEAEMLNNHTEAAAAFDARLWMTSLNVFSPLVTALCRAPGEGATEEDQIKQVMMMLAAANKLATHISEDLKRHAFDPHDERDRWTLRRILSIASESVAEQYVKLGGLDLEMLGRLYATVIRATSDAQHTGAPDSLEEKGYNVNGAMREMLQVLQGNDRFLSTDHESRIQASLLEAIKSVLIEIEQFAFWQDIDAATERATRALIEGAQWLYGQQNSAEMNANSRTMLMQASLKHAGTFYAANWKREAERVLDIYRELSPGARDPWRASYRRSEDPLSTIEAGFQASLGRLAGGAFQAKNYLKNGLKEGMDPSDKKKTGYSDSED